MEDTKSDLMENDNLTEVISIHAVCRLCAAQHCKMIGIFEEEGLLNNLPERINQYLPVKVDESDHLPLQCCWQCASTILAWHELVSTAVKTDSKLRSCEIVTQEISSNSDQLPSDTMENYIKEPEMSEDSEIIKAPDTDYSSIGEDMGNISSIDDSIPSDNINHKVECLVEYNCHLCSQSFEEEHEYFGHMREHHPEEDISELVDKKDDKEPKERRKHTKIDQEMVNGAKVVVDGRIYYNCKECGKSLHSPYTYVWHMRIHSGERPYTCDLCGKQFRVSQGLVRHLKETHAKIKNFACDLCGRMFATKRNVEEHRRIHTNERPYICDMCGKAFKQKASLFVHNRSHNDTFPYKCNYCNQGFRSKPPLLIHITRHTGEKPYPCEVCGRCFRIKYELKRHMLIHSDYKPFSCTICLMSFRQKRYLRNHNRQNHPHLVNQEEDENK